MEKGSWHIGTFAGIPVRIHWSFALIFLFFAFQVQDATNFWLSLGMESLLVGLLFLCVVLHEYGHALTARRFGVETRDIILLPIGGVARLERLPEKPLQELWIAIAGPIVNLVIAIFLAAYFFIVPWSKILELISRVEPGQGFTQPLLLVPVLLFGNLILAVFNLVPAFPMDGGRILRALLAMRMERVTATRVASIVGRIFAFVFLVLAVYLGNFVLGFISIFIYFAAGQEYSVVKMFHSLEGYTARDILRTHFTTFSPEETMAAPMSIYRQGVEKHFLVVDPEAGQPIGVLHGFSIVEAFREGKHGTPIREYMHPKLEVIRPDLSLKTLFYKMQSKGYTLLPVFEHGQLIGLVDVNGLNLFLSLSDQKRKARIANRNDSLPA